MRTTLTRAQTQLLRAVGVVALLSVFAESAKADFMYTVSDLGSLRGSTTTAAYSMNGAGQILGVSGVVGQHLTPFLYSNGTMTALSSAPAAISDTGILAYDAANFNVSGINASRVQARQGPGGVAATSINGVVTQIPGASGFS